MLAGCLFGGETNSKNGLHPKERGNTKKRLKNQQGSVIDILTLNDLVEIGENNAKPTINIEIPQPTMEDIIKQIERSIDRNPFASVGVMGFDGKMAYTYTVKAGGRY